jgi:hypothetical protein
VAKRSPLLTVCLCLHQPLHRRPPVAAWELPFWANALLLCDHAIPAELGHRQGCCRLVWTRVVPFSSHSSETLGAPENIELIREVERRTKTLAANSYPSPLQQSCVSSAGQAVAMAILCRSQWAEICHCLHCRAGGERTESGKGLIVALHSTTYPRI